MELGIYSFVENTANPGTGKMISPHERISNIIEEMELAEQVGLDVFAIGEHHRPDYLASSPAIILAAAAVRTKKIRLSSAVTVLSSDDPVRVFQQFAMVDLLSKGRAEIMAGRGSFIESFPLFGYNLQDYDTLFSEKLELLLELNKNEKVNWKGKFRPAIDNLGVYPGPYGGQLPIWIAVGGTTSSIIRAGKLGLPMALAIIGGTPYQFSTLVQLYRDTYQKSGHNMNNLQLGINSHAYVSDTSQKASDEFYPTYADVMTKIGKERGWPPTNRQQFEASISSHGALLVGSPQQVIDKIIYEYDLFHNSRFLAQMSVGTMPHAQIMRSIELFGTKVAPEVKKHVQRKQEMAQ